VGRGAAGPGRWPRSHRTWGHSYRSRRELRGGRCAGGDLGLKPRAGVLRRWGDVRQHGVGVGLELREVGIGRTCQVVVRGIGRGGGLGQEVVDRRLVRASCADGWRRGLCRGGGTLYGGVGEMHGQMDTAGARSDFDEFPVLPFKVQVVQQVDRVVPSFVRSHVFDRGGFRFRKPVFRFVLFDGPQKIGGVGCNWKIRTAIDYHAVALDQSGEQQIETCAQRIDDGAHLGIENRIGWAKTVKDHQDVAALIRVRLHDDVIWAAPQVGHESPFEAWDLGYGPVNSGLGIKKVVTHG